MSGKDRINIFPSRGAQTLMKGRLKGAQKGHSLLKKKADALQMRFRQILQKIVATKTEMGDVMKDCAFSLAEAKFQAGEFNQVSPGLRNLLVYHKSSDSSLRALGVYYVTYILSCSTNVVNSITVLKGTRIIVPQAELFQKVQIKFSSTQ